MAAHALGAAAYAAKAAGLGDGNRPEGVEDVIHWQLDHFSAELRTALRALPPIGQNSSVGRRVGRLAASLILADLVGEALR